MIPGFGTRRYVYRRIDSGEEYLVAGHTERRQNDVVLPGDLVITDRSPRRFAFTRLRKVVFPTPTGLGFLVIGFGGMVL